MKRTHLPLNGMRVLDAAARHLSFTRAADELAVTPAAVGQQIRALEDTLGVVLFRRTTKGLELTPEAESGLTALRNGFLQFEEAVRAMQAGQSSKSLTIAAPRDLTAKWLMPRLSDIARADPDLRFVLVPADDALDFTEANLDLAIRWGEGPGEHEGEALESDGMVTVERPGGGSIDVRISWPGCMAEDAGSLVRVADAGLAIDAAAQGLGRATVPELLARADIEGGRVAVVGEPKASRLGYWLVAPLPQWRQKKVQTLVEVLGG
ncbi:LysR family transcriptional regulator [Sphingomonas sp. ABOLD]|uniref:LysR family glycine cleavage system transcriptional activator n=1 Tax=Sphingomonas trueperi TaxID=53317 RepID=A0A7X5Y1D1_9SPHN|nr:MULTISPECIES: LysR family transcriptional regulator [unclassified Sphingomonas]NJB99194.1 LysR family glycine cleavage system transcriptional activator [Sphingomonas trueperi]RSV40313.1 LysR family transcriptional regulator [Sphingomonas sp. ABOLE]RSV52481.1 LysR family transcriptional regulator [Sphingomonas sp. ABOLD]